MPERGFQPEESSRSSSESGIAQEEHPKAAASEVRIIDGRTYERKPNGYTVREYYSHSTSKGPGPGWDNRARLLNDDYAMKVAGRTFTDKEIYNSNITDFLPDTPMYEWVEQVDELYYMKTI